MIHILTSTCLSVCLCVCAGPPNVPFTRKPYRDLDLEEDRQDTVNSTSVSKAEKEKKRKSGDLPPPQPRLHPSMYPSLSTSNSVSQKESGQYHAPPVAPPTVPQSTWTNQQQYGGYGAPTYPNQQVYQQQGVAYGTGYVPDERSRLVNQ